MIIVRPVSIMITVVTELRREGLGFLEAGVGAAPATEPGDGRACINASAKLKFDRFAEVRYRARTVPVEFDEDEIAEAGNLEGCYAIKTDLFDVAEVDAREVHDRYMELTEVEWAFRTMKTVLLEMRGIFVRKEGRTRAHVFIIMLAYLLHSSCGACGKARR